MQLGILYKRFSALVVCLLLLFVFSLESTEAQEQSTTTAPGVPFQEMNVAAPLCRFGVNITADITQFGIDQLRLGWYLNYGTSTNPARPQGIRYAQMIRLAQDAQGNYSYHPSKTAILQIAQAQPGSAWFIGNEPDRRKYQDEIDPDVYARVYHDLYMLIKEADPTAQILAGSIVQPTPVRLKYLDIVLDTYQDLYSVPMPVDAWSIHNFILNEASCEHFDIFSCWGAEIPPGIDDKEGMRVSIEDNDNFTLFVEQMERFRRWMNDNGYRSTPLYLSEYGVLMPAEYGFPAERVNEFMNKTFDYILTKTDANTGYPADGNRLVQRLSWYSLTDTDYNGRLFEAETKQRTEIGDNFANYVAKLSVQADFYPVSVQASTVPISISDAQTVTLEAVIANSGNTLSAYPLSVKFYDGDPTQDGKQIGETQTVTLAGCGETKKVSVQWPDRSVGKHSVYVTVDPVDNSAPESTADKANNTLQGSVFVGSHRVFAPRIGRR